jgi:putative oxidoreductase
MKKYPPIIAGVLLGLLFIMSAVMVLFNLVKAPPPPEGSPAAMFFGAFAPTGYLTFVKVLELVGGVARDDSAHCATSACSCLAQSF